MNKIFTIIFLLIFLTYSCKSFNKANELNKNNITGTFYDKKGGTHELILNTDSTFIYKYVDRIYAYFSPVIAKGNYKLTNDGYIILDNKGMFDGDNFVIREVKGGSKDSLYFYFKSPIDTIEDFSKGISYYVSPDLREIYCDKNEKNNITLNKKDYILVDNTFSFGYHINCNYFDQVPAKPLYFLDFRLKNEDSNIFYIDLNFLTYEFVVNKRIKEEYAKIISRNKIKWRGREFIKIK